ncbi:MAG: DUF6282 family protein [Sedimentibacter sp.]|uniref:DUF6282 family protein n=1 Tax=Sedimentibacter sp. TaxID=1960295 RepID=UPI003158FB46
MENYLVNAYDIHLHTSPDVVERKLDDEEMAKRASARGMKGFVIKNHYQDTSQRAAAVSKKYPNLNAAGGITLNQSVGGICADSVEKAAKTGAKFVWFPTMDALSYSIYKKKDTGSKISILKDGVLIPEVYDVLDVIKQYKMILCTGHISFGESLALIQAGHMRGITKMILTHADSPSVFTDCEQQLKFVKEGAFIEHSSFTLEVKATSWDLMKEQILNIGSKHIVLSSDLGQVSNPYPDDSLNEFVKGLLERGMYQSEIDQMIRTNPDWLLSDMY